MPRKSSYKAEYDEKARNLCLLGAKDTDLCGFFDITEKTINNWKRKYPSFLQALKDGKLAADATIAASLFGKARGYEWDEEVPIKTKHVEYENGKRVSEHELVKMVTVHKVIPPDTTAIIFWLKNRNKENWRDRQEVTGADGGPVETTTLTYMPQQLKSNYFESDGPSSTTTA